MSDDLFCFSHRQLFSKIYTLHSKFTPFSLYFSFFVSVSAFFHVFFIKNKKFSSDYWGAKKGFPILIIGGAHPRAAPQSLRLCQAALSKIQDTGTVSGIKY